MTLANDSFNRVADTTGTNLATHLIAAKEHPVVLQAGPSGHIIGTVPTFSWWVPGQILTSASKILADLFNSTASTQTVEVRGLWAVPKADVATAPAIAVEVGLYRTTAVGSSGVANVFSSGATSTAHTITPMNSTDTYSTANITARAAPLTSLGPAASALWWAQYVITEETNAGTMIAAMTNLMPVDLDARRLTLNPGEGLQVKMGTVASTGSMALIGQLVIY
jgi:hypothetical protein